MIARWLRAQNFVHVINARGRHWRRLLADGLGQEARARQSIGGRCARWVVMVEEESEATVARGTRDLAEQ